MIKNILPAVFLSFIIAFFCGFLMVNNYILLVGIIGLVVLAILASKSPLVFLISIVIIYAKGFQIIDFGIPHWMYKDVALIALGVGLLVQFIKNGYRLHASNKNVYFRYICLIFSIVFLSIFIGSWWIYKQPINTLVFRARAFLLYFIFLYLLMVNFNSEQIKKFIKFVLYSALIVSVLVIIDAKLLGGGKIFNLAMSNGVSGYRFGAVRIFTYPFVTIWAYFYLLSNIRFNPNNFKKAFYALGLGLIIFQLIFCNMTRQILVMLLLSTAVFMIRLKTTSRILIGCFIGGIITLIVLTYSFSGEFSMNNILGNFVQQTQYEAGQTTEGNIAIRRNAIKYFYPYFEKTRFLGIGMMSVTHKDSPISVGSSKGYIFADLGFFAILFRFGIFAVMLIFFVLKRVFKDLCCIQKTKDIETKIIANSLIYVFVSKIILLPTSTIFFSESSCLYYAILFYFICRMRRDSKKEAEKLTVN